MGAIADGIVAFAQPLIDQTDGSVEQLNKAFAIAQLCFNLALSPEEIREQTLRDMQPTFAMNDEEFDAFRRAVIDPMIRRHVEMFPRMHGRDFTDPLPDGPSPWALPRTAAAEKRATVTDRYAPCPCGSGEKYKFCCGKKKR